MAWSPVGSGGGTPGAGGATWKPVAGGGGGGAKVLSASTVRSIRKGRQYIATLKQSAATPDIGQQIGDIASSVPTGLLGLGVATAKEVANAPVNIVGGIIHGNPEQVIEGIPITGQAVGLGKGFLTGKETTENPLSSMFGTSFRRTGEDIIHPTRLIDAYNNGTIVGKLLEDAANVSIVAGAAGKALNIASRGAFAEAATAGTAAEAGDAAAQTASKVAEQAAQRATEANTAAERLAGIVEQVKGPARVQAAATYEKAAALARDAQGAADEAAAGAQARATEAATAKALHEAALAKAGPGYGAYRIVRTVSDLGNRGAMAPVKLYTVPLEGLSKLARGVLTKSPALQHALSLFDEKVGVSEFIRHRRDALRLSAEERNITAAKARELSTIERVLGRVDRLTGGDEAVYQAALVVDDFARAIAPQVAIMGRAGADVAGEGYAQMIHEVALKNHYNEAGLKLAVDDALGRADPAVSARLRQIRQLYDDQIAPIAEQSLRDEMGAGRRRNPAAEQRRTAAENLGGNDLLSIPVRKVGRQAQQRGAQAEGALRGLAERAQRQREGLELPAGLTRTQERNLIAGRIAQERAQVRPPGALRRYGEQQAFEARALVARDAAERFRALRERVPPSIDDATVGRLADAVGRLQETRDLVLQEPAADPALVGRVREIRTQARAVAKAELDALPEVWHPDNPLPFIPGDLSEFHSALHVDLGELRETGWRRQIERVRARHAAWSDEKVAVAAYKRLYERLPGAAKHALAKLDDEAIGHLYREWRAGNTDPLGLGRLDERANSYVVGELRIDSNEQAGSYAEVDRYLTDYAHQARLQEFLRTAKANQGWSQEALQAFAQGRTGGPLGELLRDPATRAAMTRGANLEEVAGEFARQREAQAGPALPDAAAVADAEAGQPFPYDENAGLGIVEAAFGGGPEGDAFNAFYDRWVEAGMPDLNESIAAMREGNPPPWWGVSPDEPALAADARGEIEGLIGEQGGQALRDPMAQEARLLSSAGTRASNAAKRREGSAQAAVEAVSTPAARAGLKVGAREYGRYLETLRKIGVQQRRIANLEEWTAREIDKLYRDVENYPAPYRHVTRMAREFTLSISNWMADANVDATLTDADRAVLNEAVSAGIKDLNSFFTKVAGPGGSIARLEREGMPRPRFVPGGQPLRRAEEGIPPAQPTTRPIRSRKAREEHMARGGARPRTTAELRRLFADRLDVRAKNDGARMVQRLFGHTAEAVLGEEALALDPRALAAFMREQPERYVAWDAEALIQSTAKARRVAPAVQALSDEAVNAGTTFLPQHIYNAIKDYYGAGGNFESFMRRYYDRPMTYWRAAVLALRPAWHVNNIVGNAFMAMTGAGMGPIEYANRIRQAHALLALPEAQLDVALPETVARRGLFAGAREARLRNPARLAKLERRVGGIEAPTLAGLRGPGGEISPPHAVTQREAGASLTQESDLAKLAHPDQAANGLARFVHASYRLNGAVDDINRLAVFLHERANLSPADVGNLVARNPELTGLSMEQLRTEGAIRLSLRIAGDFTRMTPLERQVFRRIVPFYVWIRHITGLARHLAATSPIRVIWMLHLAEMWGDPSKFGLVNALPIPGGLLQMPSINPYQDVIDVGQPTSFGFNLSPAIKFPLGAVGGLDVNRMAQFQRPPGQPGGYGGAPGPTSLLGRPGELAHLALNQVPQARPLTALADLISQGHPVMRYPLGQVRRSPVTQGAEPLASGEPVYGPALRYLGVPYVRQPNVYEAQDLRARVARRRAKTKGRA